jgi:hypothetical protein
MTAGTSSPRTIVASRKIATASPTPSCLIEMTERVAKVEKTATITIAALVTTPAERCRGGSLGEVPPRSAT